MSILQELMTLNEKAEETTLKGYKPFKLTKSGYNDGREWTGGDAVVNFDGEEWVFTGKTGKNNTSGELSFEYQNGHARIWVTASGKVVKD